jgi:hypothetical protein
MRRRGPHVNVAVEVGQRIDYDGRTYIVRGFAPGGSVERLVLLEDAEHPSTIIAVSLARLEDSN